MVTSKKLEATGYIIVGLFVLTILIPFILLLVSSLTEEITITRNGYSFFPAVWSLKAYDYLMKHISMILRAYGITVFVTVVGTVASLAITCLCAYPLSRRDLPGLTGLKFFVFFTMLFNGGLIPTYLLYTQLFHIKNTVWALIVPNLLMAGYYVNLARAFYATSIPSALIEAARLDGAGEFRTFLQIVTPLSKPIIATLGMFIAVGYWNDWQNGLIYLTNSRLFSIQVLLNKMTSDIQFLQNSSQFATNVSLKNLPSQSVRMAIAVIGLIPMFCAYPFFQKYFVKGIALGAVKE